MRRPRRADHLPRLDGAGPRPGDHAARPPLGRRTSGTADDYVWVFEISRRGAAGALRRRLRRAPSASASRRCTSASAAARIKGISQAGRDRLEPHLRRWTARCTWTSAAARVVELPDGGDRAPLAGDHPAVADHARGPPRRDPRPDDGPAQGQPHPGRLRPDAATSATRPSRPRPRCSTRWASASTSAAIDAAG